MRLLRTFSLLSHRRRPVPNWTPACAGVTSPARMTSIYRICRLAAFEHRGQVGGRCVAHHDARRARGAADVRREDHVRELREFGIELRLALEDVEPRAGDALRLQRV